MIGSVSSRFIAHQGYQLIHIHSIRFDSIRFDTDTDVDAKGWLQHDVEIKIEFHFKHTNADADADSMAQGKIR